MANQSTNNKTWSHYPSFRYLGKRPASIYNNHCFSFPSNFVLEFRSGEAEYVNDIPKMPGELFGAFVLTTVGNASLKSVDASEALVGTIR